MHTDPTFDPNSYPAPAPAREEPREVSRRDLFGLFRRPFDPGGRR